MSVRSTITELFKQVAIEQKVALAPLTDDLLLGECGLDSLSVAIIVTRLEDELEVDPFSDAERFEFPVTFGEFVKSYEDAA